MTIACQCLTSFRHCERHTPEQDEGNGAVAYRPAVDNVWALEVPLEAATNQAELHDYQVRWRASTLGPLKSQATCARTPAHAGPWCQRQRHCCTIWAQQSVLLTTLE